MPASPPMLAIRTIFLGRPSSGDADQYSLAISQVLMAPTRLTFKVMSFGSRGRGPIASTTGQQ